MHRSLVFLFAVAAMALSTGCDTSDPGCTSIALCVAGYEWDDSACACVPTTPACQVDSDCQLHSSYCEGCTCLALSKGAPIPVCTGQTVQCFADPCLHQTAVCVSGQCTTRSTRR